MFLQNHHTKLSERPIQRVGIFKCAPLGDDKAGVDGRRIKPRLQPFIATALGLDFYDILRPIKQEN